jgi:hypothetical protein
LNLILINLLVLYLMEQTEIEFYRTLNNYHLSNEHISRSYNQQKLDVRVNFIFLGLVIIFILLTLSFLLVDKN